MVSSSQGSPVSLFRTPPQRSTTFSPPRYTQQAPPNSFRSAKFSAKASRTASKPALTCPWMVTSSVARMACGLLEPELEWWFGLRADGGAPLPRPQHEPECDDGRRQQCEVFSDS